MTGQEHHRIAPSGRVATSALFCFVLLLAVAGAIGAQAPPTGAGTQTCVVRSASDVSFRMLAAAPFQWHYAKKQTRRFLDHQGGFVEVRESLEIRGDGSDQSPFRLSFLDLATPVSNAEKAHWEDTYRTHAGLLHKHGGFRVRDLGAAQANYSIHDFGVSTRINRAIRRAIVFPRRLDKGIWVLDIDVATGVLLYSAEYDASAQLISEIEATEFVLTNQSAVSATKPLTRWGWQPRMVLHACSTIPDAASHVSGATIIEPDVSMIMGEYVRHLVQVTENPVNGDKTIVLAYTDGIDEFFVMQTPAGANPLLLFPSSTAAKGTHTIANYNDPGLRVFVFHERGVLFQIVGRDSLARLRDVAMRVCRQAVTGN